LGCIQRPAQPVQNGEAMHLKTGLSFGAACAWALFVLGTASADITYVVDQRIGEGSVIGTITTDGATGVLSAGDIVSWSLLLDGIGASYLLTSTSPIAEKHVIGNDLAATTTDIYFNFGGAAGGQFLLQNGGEGGQNYWCNSVGYTSCYPGKSDVPVFYTNPSSQFDMTAMGNQIIASTSGVVPEPSSWALMLLGIAGLGYAGWRRGALAASVAVV